MLRKKKHLKNLEKFFPLNKEKWKKINALKKFGARFFAYHFILFYLFLLKKETSKEATKYGLSWKFDGFLHFSF